MLDAGCALLQYTCQAAVPLQPRHHRQSACFTLHGPPDWSSSGFNSQRYDVSLLFVQYARPPFRLNAPKTEQNSSIYKLGYEMRSSYFKISLSSASLMVWNTSSRSIRRWDQRFSAASAT